MGVANDRSLAWGIAKALHGQGARLAFTYQGEALGKARPARSPKASTAISSSTPTVTDEAKPRFGGSRNLARRWARLDFPRATRSRSPTRTS